MTCTTTSKQTQAHTKSRIRRKKQNENKKEEEEEEGALPQIESWQARLPTTERRSEKSEIGFNEIGT